MNGARLHHVASLVVAEFSTVAETATILIHKTEAETATTSDHTQRRESATTNLAVSLSLFFQDFGSIL